MKWTWFGAICVPKSHTWCSLGSRYIECRDREVEPEAEILKRKKSGGIPRGSVSVHVVPAVPVGKCVMTPYTSQPESWWVWLIQAPGIYRTSTIHQGGFPGALVVKNPPANAGDLRDVNSIPGSGRFPGEGLATHSNILAWRIPWTEDPAGYNPWGHKELDTTEVTACTHAYTRTCGCFRGFGSSKSNIKGS